jgi:hypothetical protein
MNPHLRQHQRKRGQDVDSMQIVSSRSAGRTVRMMIAAAVLVMVRTSSPAQYTRSPERTITGTVQDASREPLRGAVVQMEEAGALVIRSYVTDERGEYHFRNVSSNADFTLWATFRGNKSKTFSISKFDHKLDRAIPLEIVLNK